MENKQNNNYFVQQDGTFHQQQQAASTFQPQQPQQQQQQQPAQQVVVASSSSSPRRRNAPIDIDTALRLQSQATCVQEPARASVSPSSGASSSAGSKTLSSPHGGASPCPPQSSATPPPTSSSPQGALAGPSPSCHKKPPLHQQHASTRLSCASTSTTQPLARRQSQPYTSNCNVENANYYDHHYYGATQVTNISVDYIDCLSNNDLPAAAPASQASQATTMRGIPSCRRHLSRFHRSHKVEPDSGAPQGAAAGQRQLMGPTTASSSDGDSSPNVDSRGKLASGDTSSLVTCSNSTDCSSFDQQHQQTTSAPATNQSVLYPISVSEVKKRTYFIGSVSQDSLLSHDELHRYFPNGKVSIFVCTWNQNRKRAPVNLNDLLLPDQLVYMPDIYSIGIQEAYSSQADYLREWEIELQTTLGPSHVLLHSCSLGSLHLAIFIRRDLIWFCSTAEESLYNSRSMPTNMIKTKGAISIAFRFFGTSFMFTNCHFPAHENKLKDRIDEYQRIINSIDLPKNLKLLKPRYLSSDSTARFDCVFFMGDLNFRLEHRTFDETIQILDDIFQSKELCYEALTQNDELLKVMESQQAFHGFDESQIKFPPTYKFLAQTNKYDRQTKRVPSYTDRILFRSKRQRHIQCLIYDWLPQLMSSDHKPVYSLFDVLVRPGHEQNMVSSLNAGLFQRAVYIEALKRRAEDPDGIRENGASGNLICSIT